MDRIAALRRIEDALAEFETGDTELEECERRVRAAVRTFATEFDGDRSAYRSGSGTIVVATSERKARERVRELTDVEAPTVERID
ncbi:MAG: hypothetical protein ACI8UR_001876 [Natronomonas sp.]|jgi:hypothetical protein|uniref:DUF7854 family protein n=1 Tax=Natronomonas sp. TaxID=2184060 RepID=UPI0039897C33